MYLCIYLFICLFTWIFVWALQSKIQLHDVTWAWMIIGNHWKPLVVFGNTDVIILHWYSQDCLKEDYLYFTFISVFLHARDSVPIGSLYGSISNLVCVWERGWERVSVPAQASKWVSECVSEWVGELTLSLHKLIWFGLDWFELIRLSERSSWWVSVRVWLCLPCSQFRYLKAKRQKGVNRI